MCVIDIVIGALNMHVFLLFFHYLCGVNVTVVIGTTNMHNYFSCYCLSCECCCYYFLPGTIGTTNMHLFAAVMPSVTNVTNGTPYMLFAVTVPSVL